MTVVKNPDQLKGAVLYTGIGIRNPEQRLSVEGRIDVFAPQALVDSLTIIRDRNTPMSQFKHNADIIFGMQGSRLVETLPRRVVEIETPVGLMTTEVSDSRGVLIIGILRSGYPAALGIRTSMPNATIGVVDIKRDEETAKPSMFYDGLSSLDLSSFAQVIIPDPMLATGGSASMVIDMLKERGAENIHLVSLAQHLKESKEFKLSIPMQK